MAQPVKLLAVWHQAYVEWKIRGLRPLLFISNAHLVLYYQFALLYYKEYLT